MPTNSVSERTKFGKFENVSNFGGKIDHIQIFVLKTPTVFSAIAKQTVIFSYFLLYPIIFWDH